METQLIDAAVYEEAAALLDYPVGELALPERLAACPEGAEAGAAFVEAMAALAPAEREELHVRTFDFTPLCAPYVGVHLFGGQGESFKRSGFMAALAGAYREAGFDAGSELPDHLAVILRARACFSPEEWEDMVRCCLEPATRFMRDELDRNRNPYRHAIEVLRRLFAAEFPEESPDA